MEGTREIPLFPLGQVLFLGGCMSLRIFEPRYVDMVRGCLRDESGFGVVLIRAGGDTWAANESAHPDIFNIGTFARIVDFDGSQGGLFNIKIRGEYKFRIHETREQPDHLLRGDVERLPEEREARVGEDFELLTSLLEDLMRHPLMAERWGDAIDLDDARAVSWRLSDMLPFSPEIKQGLLQMHLPRERLTEIRRLVNKLRG